MESDVQEPTVSPEHLLNKYLPLPYRVAVLIVLGKASIPPFPSPNPIPPTQTSKTTNPLTESLSLLPLVLQPPPPHGPPNRRPLPPPLPPLPPSPRQRPAPSPPPRNPPARLPGVLRPVPLRLLPDNLPLLHPARARSAACVALVAPRQEPLLEHAAPRCGWRAGERCRGTVCGRADGGCAYELCEAGCGFVGLWVWVLDWRWGGDVGRCGG